MLAVLLLLLPRLAVAIPLASQFQQRMAAAVLEAMVAVAVS